MNVLVLNCYSRNALSVINSLDFSYRIHGAHQGQAKISDRFLKSPRLLMIHRYTKPSRDIEVFQKDIINLSLKYHINAIIPTGTAITNSISQIKEAIELHSRAKVLVEDYSKLQELTDKWRCYKLCDDLKIPYPKTQIVHGFSDMERCITSELIDFPCIIKPIIGTAAVGVHFFKNRNDLDRFRNQSHTLFRQFGSFVMQDQIQGQLHDVTSCSQNGHILSMLTQQRLVCWKDFGGGGIINRTTYHPLLMEYVKKILYKTRWNGVALWDFIQKENGEFYLLECNPKFWGTTQLTIEAGLNMPQQLVDFWFLKREIKPLRTYEIGVVYKWLFPFCIAHLFHSPLRIKTLRKRFVRVFRKYESTRSRTNINPADFPHLLGMILNADFSLGLT